MAERLAVVGSPIAHSLSPDIHLAAYEALGLDWSYERIEVQERELEAFLEEQGRGFRGLSVTAPLKSELVRLAGSADRVATLTASANTAIGLAAGTPQVFNTDVAGIVHAFAHHGVTKAEHAVLLGGGATAASALLALADLGVETVDVRLRNVRKAGPLITLGREVGLMVLVDDLNPNFAEVRVDRADVLVSTLPSGVLDPFVREYADRAPVALDVAYDPWPSVFASELSVNGGVAIPGAEMLLQQAVIQVRIFVNGDPFAELPNEPDVVDRMRRAIPVLCQD